MKHHNRTVSNMRLKITLGICSLTILFLGQISEASKLQDLPNVTPITLDRPIDIEANDTVYMNLNDVEANESRLIIVDHSGNTIGTIVRGERPGDWIAHGYIKDRSEHNPLLRTKAANNENGTNRYNFGSDENTDVQVTRVGDMLKITTPKKATVALHLDGQQRPLETVNHDVTDESNGFSVGVHEIGPDGLSVHLGDEHHFTVSRPEHPEQLGVKVAHINNGHLGTLGLNDAVGEFELEEHMRTPLLTMAVGTNKELSQQLRISFGDQAMINGIGTKKPIKISGKRFTRPTHK